MAKFKIVADRKYEVWAREEYIVEADTFDQAGVKVENDEVEATESKYLVHSEQRISAKENYVMAECDTLIPDDNGIDYEEDNSVFDIQEKWCELLEGEAPDWVEDEDDE